MLAIQSDKAGCCGTDILGSYWGAVWLKTWPEF